MPFAKGIGDSITLNSKDYKILESNHDELDNVLRLKVAMATKEEKSDGKSTKRSS